MELLKEQVIQEWQGCYSEGWDSELLVCEAFSHPAKFSKNLISRIYQYMLERDYIKPGDTVLDPFGGVGLGAVATFYGLNWVGVELEQKFHDIGNGCRCTGLSVEEYCRFYARFRPDAIHRLNYKDGRHFCPACLASLGKVEESPAVPLSYQSKKRRARIADLQKRIGKRLGRAVSLVDPLPFPEKYRPALTTHSLFDEPADSGPVYRRNSGRIPTVQPHTYEGNLSRFKKYAQPGTTALLVQGDSRRLRARLAEVIDSVVSSPPYADGVIQKNNRPDTKNTRRMNDLGRPGNGKAVGNMSYGNSEGQLGGMTEGTLANSLVASPPFAGNTGGRGEASRNGIDAALFDRHSGGMKRGTGDSPENLDHLPMKGLEEALGGLVSSPPYHDQEVPDWSKKGSLAKNKEYDRSRPSSARIYGNSEGQLSGLPSGSLADSLVSSPPYINSVNQSDQANDSDARIERMKAAGIDTTNRANVGGGNGVARQPQAYGKSEGQLGAMKEGFPPAPPPPSSPAALVSSPPFIESVGSDLPEKRGGLLKSDPKRAGDRNLTGSYGSAPGQLGAMRNGGLDASVGSPPYEGSDQDYARGWKSIDPVNRPSSRRGKQVEASYGKAEGQLGIEQGQTFWAAARQIVTESYLALKPGAYSAWVLKAFIRDHERVDFPGQWRQLCEVCGFEYVEEIRAMQVSEAKYQGDLSGGVNTIQKATKSFFRRTYEKKFPNNRIDWEVVLIMRKPPLAPSGPDAG